MPQNLLKFLICNALFFLCTLNVCAAFRLINYNIQVNEDYLDIDLCTVDQSSTSTEIQLPILLGHSGNELDLLIETTISGSTNIVHAKYDYLTLSHNAGDEVCLKYKLHNPNYPQKHLFYVKKDGFFINGLNALASVNSEQDVKINLKFHNWQDQIISNFKKNNSQKHTFNWAGKKDDLLQSFFISDGYFLTEDKKSQINIIAPKNWNKDFINKVIKYLSKITIKCNKFFTAQDHAFLPTNNSFILIEQENSLFGTEGVAQQGSNFSYQVIASSDLYNNNFTNELKHTLIHEYLHQWIGLKLKAEVPQDSRWFFEGAVDYYSAKLGYISGFYDSDGFFKFYNNNLREYYAYNFDKAEISEMTRQTPIYDLLEYKIGFLLSSIIDNELSKMNPKYNLDFFIKNIVNEEKNFDLKEFFKKNKIYYKY